MLKLHEVEFVFSHPYYCRDLAPSDFLNLRKFLGKILAKSKGGKRCRLIFLKFLQRFFSDDLKDWEKRSTKCIEL